MTAIAKNLLRAPLLLLCAACLSGSGCDTETGGSAERDVTGRWSGTLTVWGENSATRADLEQSGNEVTGTWDGVSVYGSIYGSSLALTGYYVQDGTPVTATISGTVGASSISGSISFEVDGSEVSRGTFSVSLM